MRLVLFIFLFSVQCYSLEQIQLLKAKQLIRNEIINHSLNSDTNKSAPLSNDRVEDLIPFQKITKNIYQIEEMSLTKGKVLNQPWSDDYWPIYKGILGNRYADLGFQNTFDWKESQNYVILNPVSRYTKSNIEFLSPSERFDLLLSDNKFSLTKSMWAQGEKYFNANGSVERWMGICHGWAAASFMVKRPQKKITVKSFDGKLDIPFYPSDIKALASLLWASSRFETLFVGGRCRSKFPELDDNDRPLSKDCLDNNPSTFHLALINRVGKQKKSFIMDATFDYEVWNQPVVSYSFEYFNPQTEKVGSLESSILNKKDFRKDKFENSRSSDAKFILGINLTVNYGVETSPQQLEFDNESHDQLSSANYQYDLEIDNNGKIIGGEWHTEEHPDFLWLPSSKAKAITSYDYYLLDKEKWNGKKNLDKNIKSLAQKAAVKGKPLAFIVNSLIELAQ